jgi:hypothetical protein
LVGFALALLPVVTWVSPFPLELRLVSIEPGGMVDGAGVEALLVILRVTNRANVMIPIRGNAYKVEARIGDHWFELRDRMRMSTLWMHQASEELIVMPGGTTACRLKLDYLPEPMKLRLWRGLGMRTQNAAERVLPKPFIQWLLSAPAPRSEDYRPICLEVALPAVPR